MKSKAADKIEITEDLIQIIVGLYCVWNDFKKVRAWLRAKNLNFGGFSPAYLIACGRSGRVLEFIEDAAHDPKNNLYCGL